MLYVHGQAHHGIEYGYHLKPSLGTDGEFCVCYQPAVMAGENNMLHTLSSDLQAKQEKVKNARNEVDAEELSTASDDDIYYLYAVDFEQGTYRIKQPGRYVVMEDIEFNPNRGTIGKGAANDDMEAWRPHEDQQVDF